jgi:hypothetical protein
MATVEKAGPNGVDPEATRRGAMQEVPVAIKQSPWLGAHKFHFIVLAVILAEAAVVIVRGV